MFPKLFDTTPVTLTELCDKPLWTRVWCQVQELAQLTTIKLATPQSSTGNDILVRSRGFPEEQFTCKPNQHLSGCPKLPRSWLRRIVRRQRSAVTV